MVQEAQRRNSIDFFFCTPQDMQADGRLFFWSYIYYLSKFYEFVDTLLLLLRRKETSVLHVFHHTLVLLMAWLWVDQAQTLQVRLVRYSQPCDIGAGTPAAESLTGGQTLHSRYSEFAAHCTHSYSYNLCRHI